MKKKSAFFPFVTLGNFLFNTKDYFNFNTIVTSYAGEFDLHPGVISPQKEYNMKT